MIFSLGNFWMRSLLIYCVSRVKTRLLTFEPLTFVSFLINESSKLHLKCCNTASSASHAGTLYIQLYLDIV